MRRKSSLFLVALFFIFFFSSKAIALVHKQHALVKTVVIDPGHGGRDSGAVGYGKVLEKNVNLAIAKKLSLLLSRVAGLKVVLTRANDNFVGLKERAAIANRSSGDLFVSIHTNASTNVSASGAETYFLSVDVSDPEARRVAAFENGVIDMENGFKRNINRRSNVGTILWDLTQNEFMKESSGLAEIVQNNLGRIADEKLRGVKQAPFIVLSEVAMPSVLIEIGFITNRKDATHLSSNKGQERVAFAIYMSVRKFIKLSSKMQRHFDLMRRVLQ